MSAALIAPDDKGDYRYYRRFLNFSFIWNLAHGPRRRMYACFIESLKPKESDLVLDVGTASLPEPLENMFELYYPHKHRITAAGTEDCSFLEKAYPGLRFVRLESRKPLPFADDSFDIVFSNAVIEHVGSREDQKLFLRELLRVSKRAFLTTPNRWFPFELHTRLPFLHWLPAPLFRAVLAKTSMKFYSREENLNLLSAKELMQLVPAGNYKTLLLKRNFFLGLPSNLMLIVEKA